MPLKVWFLEKSKVLGRLALQSLAPLVLAATYASWDYQTAAESSKTAAGWVKSFGIAFFFLMWLTGQWLRTSKQLSDAEQLTTIQRLLQDLKSATDAATSESSSPAVTGPSVARENIPATEDVVRRVLDELSKSKNGALLLLGAELERALRQLLWASGWQQGLSNPNVTNSIAHLQAMGVLPANLGGSVRLFLDTRSRLLHGRGVVPERDIVAAIDSGVHVLRAVLAIPVELNRVYHPGVDVYTDAECTHKLEEVLGVVLETKSPGGVWIGLRIFPTTRKNFRKGMRVTWEWNFGMTVGPTWWRHLEKGTIEQAWSSAAEFVGRDVEEI